MYVHKSLYEMLETAFDRSDVPWSCCVHEDRGDGALVLVPPTIPVAGLATVPDRLRVLGFLDSLLLWGNLSVSLLVIVIGALLVPALSLRDAWPTRDRRLSVRY